MTVEFLERIGMGFHHDVWMVRLDGVFGQAQVYDGGDPEWERQVEAETRPWLAFRHERVAPIWSASRTGERLVVVHGDERGPSITKMAALIADASERLRWAADQVAGVAEAIATAAWRQPGFIHRRAEPEHMFVAPDGQVRLRAFVAFVKWGKIGSYTGRSNAFTGSVRYMSPEQAKGGVPTPATDVHALASTLWGCITGRPPFARTNEMETLMAIVDSEPPPLPAGIPPALGELLRASLAKDPVQRPIDAATFAAELRRCMPESLAPELLAKVASLRPDARPAPHVSELIAGFRCSKKWEELTETRAAGVRHCDTCKHDVVEVRSLQALIPLLGQRCVSFKPDEGN